MVGLARSAIYDKMTRGEFPRPLRIGPGSVRWRSDDIKRWIASLPRSRGDGLSKRKRQDADSGCSSAA